MRTTICWVSASGLSLLSFLVHAAAMEASGAAVSKLVAHQIFPTFQPLLANLELLPINLVQVKNVFPDTNKCGPDRVTINLLKTRLAGFYFDIRISRETICSVTLAH